VSSKVIKWDLNLLTVKQGNQIIHRKIVAFAITFYLSVKLQLFTEIMISAGDFSNREEGDVRV